MGKLLNKSYNRLLTVLNEFKLSEVKDAIGCAKMIMQRNEENGYFIAIV
jgi:hypothetical protein